MKSMWLAAIVLAANTWAGVALADQLDSLQGTWKGPWYIGMTSGLATMQIAPDGSGTIALTNLENFGEEPVALTKTRLTARHSGSRLPVPAASNSRSACSSDRAPNNCAATASTEASERVWNCGARTEKA